MGVQVRTEPDGTRRAPARPQGLAVPVICFGSFHALPGHGRFGISDATRGRLRFPKTLRHRQVRISPSWQKPGAMPLHQRFPRRGDNSPPRRGAGGDPQSPGWGAPGTRAARLGVGGGCQEPHREVVQPPPKSPSSPRGRLSPPAAPGSPATFSNPSPRRAPEQPRPLGSRPPAPEPGFQPAAAPPVSPYLK